MRPAAAGIAIDVGAGGNGRSISRSSPVEILRTATDVGCQPGNYLRAYAETMSKPMW